MTTFAIDDLEVGVYSLAQAGKRLGISERRARELVAEGKFPVPTIKIGSRTRVAIAELEHFLAARGGES